MEDLTEIQLHIPLAVLPKIKALAKARDMTLEEYLSSLLEFGIALEPLEPTRSGKVLPEIRNDDFSSHAPE